MAGDVREGRASDPYREPLATPGSHLRPEKPAGSELVLNDDGTATFYDDEPEPFEDGHFTNLADGMEPRQLQLIAQDLLDAIEVDKEARAPRDKIYEDGLRRCGLGDDLPAGAPFNGSSRAVVPMMTEAVADYAARVCSELLPPEGPVKSATVGTPSNDKNERAERTARFMNYQLTQLLPSFYSELEAGFSQESLQGAFYLKPVVVDDQMDAEVVYGDMVHRPWNDGDFYKQVRITHEMPTDRWTFEENVASGLWIDAVSTSATSDNIDQTSPSIANDRIIGRSTPTENIDDVRTVYETSTLLRLDGPEDDLLPYLVTIDEDTRQVLAIYRNWEEDDPDRKRLDFLIEFPFMPWRGGVPLGLAHMIGGLSGAASGALRALLDSALLATMPTGVKLKGGVTAGGQNIRPQPGSTVEVAGSLAQDPDIRKTYMQLEFPQPSTVLFQVLGLLIDMGRGVVRTTFDEFNKMNGEMPVGTANMMIEQGLKTFGSVFGRQHRAMARFLRMVWLINKKTIDNEVVVDQFGELMVSKEDFEGPMTVIPVSDPRVFTDTQRMAGAQLVAARSDMYTQKGLPSPYKVRQVELNVMRSAKVAQPEQYLQDAPEPIQLNAAGENVAASMGMPIKAFPGQDHEAHIAQHAAFAQSPLFGANPVLAMKVLPQLVGHIGEHLGLWYDDAMKLATNEVLRATFKDPRITVEALAGVKGLEVQLDRLMAELTPEVMQHAQEVLGPVLEILQAAQKQISDMQMPQPMDPSVVAAQDVKRQEKADQAKAALEAEKEKNRTIADQKRIDDARTANERRDALAAAKLLTDKEAKDKSADVTLTTSRESNETQLEITDKNNEVKVAVADEQISSQERQAAERNEADIHKHETGLLANAAEADAGRAHDDHSGAEDRAHQAALQDKKGEQDLAKAKAAAKAKPKPVAGTKSK